jgi:hypothetical protein
MQEMTFTAGLREVRSYIKVHKIYLYSSIVASGLNRSILIPNVVTERLALLLYIWEAPGSYLGPVTLVF